RQREETCFFEVVGEGGVDRTDRARVAELADEEPWVGPLRSRDLVDNGVDLVDSHVGVAPDLELDKRRLPVLGDLAGVRGIERRPYMLYDRESGEPTEDIIDRGRERGIAHVEGRALNQDTLTGWLFEACVEDPVGAAGLPRA